MTDSIIFTDYLSAFHIFKNKTLWKVVVQLLAVDLRQLLLTYLILTLLSPPYILPLPNTIDEL